MIHHAGRAPYDLTFLKDDQSGYGLDPQLCGKCLVLIYINFKDTHLSRQLLPQCLDRRTQHLTRAAPCRKKIHQYRLEGCCSIQLSYLTILIFVVQR